jgi:hypothetical protein
VSPSIIKARRRGQPPPPPPGTADQGPIGKARQGEAKAGEQEWGSSLGAMCAAGNLGLG